MKILQIGAGSMGSRRLRDLSARPDVTVALLDERADRRERAHHRFGVKTYAQLADAMAWQPDALVISTPPGTKDDYVQLALAHRLHHFIEADIWVRNAAQIARLSAERNLVSAPSGSFEFLPVTKALAARVRDELGTLLCYQMSMATYMPGWHADEGLEYYARHRHTTAAREMIPFELHWLNARFGAPTEVAGRFEKFGALPYDFEDTWTLSMRLASGSTGQLVISMACPISYRRGACFGTNAVITWDIINGDLTVQRTGETKARHENFGATIDVIEPAYADEIGTFVDACLGRKPWPQSYAASQRSSATLAAAERSYITGKWEPVDQALDPEREPPRRS
jgi:predicted dehydrogenase